MNASCHMHMIRNTAHPEAIALRPIHHSCQGGMQIHANSLIKQRLPILGAEDDMYKIEGEGLRHRES